MNSMTIIVAAIAGVAILLIAVGIASSGGGSGVSARLERYAASGKGDKKKEKPEGLAELLAQSSALASLNRVVEQRDFGANLAREIARADLKLKPSEFLGIWAASTVGVPAIFFVIGFVMPSFQTIIALIGGLIVGFIIPRFWLSRRKSSRLGAFNKQLPDTITLVANALRAGSSFLPAHPLRRLRADGHRHQHPAPGRRQPCRDPRLDRVHDPRASPHQGRDPDADGAAAPVGLRGGPPALRPRRLHLPRRAELLRPDVGSEGQHRRPAGRDHHPRLPPAHDDDRLLLHPPHRGHRGLGRCPSCPSSSPPSPRRPSSSSPSGWPAARRWTRSRHA